jgi:protein ImuB
MRIAFAVIADFVFRAHARAPDAAGLAEGGPLSILSDDDRLRALLVDGEGGRARVVAAAPDLRTQGVQPGMTVAQARSRVGWVHAVPHQPACVEREACRVAGLLLAASPQVQVRGQGAFCLGAGGRRFLGGEGALLALVEDLLGQAGYADPRVGLADSFIAARAAALFGLGIIPPQGDQAALAPLSLAALPLEESTRRSLWSLGIRTVGAFSALPRSQLNNRFGADAVLAHRMAHGDDPRTVTTASFSECPSLEVDFESPFAVAEPALFVLQGGLEGLLAPHQRRGFGIQRLKIELVLIHGRWERDISPPDPVSDAHVLFELCRATLQDAELPSQMVGMRVKVLEVSPAQARQEGMWEARRRRESTLQVTLLRLQSRLGMDAVQMPGPVEDALLPESAAQWQPAHSRPLAKGDPALEPSAAWRLKRPPRLLSVVLDKGLPTRAQVEGRWLEIGRLAGPQRIETGWWEERPKTATLATIPRAGPPQPIRRDYWYAEIKEGSAWSIFQDLNTAQWFLQGVLD